MHWQTAQIRVIAKSRCASVCPACTCCQTFLTRALKPGLWLKMPQAAPGYYMVPPFSRPHLTSSSLLFACASQLTPALCLRTHNHSGSRYLSGHLSRGCCNTHGHAFCVTASPLQVLGMTDRPQALLAAYISAHVLACAAFHHYLGGLQWPLALMRVSVSLWDVLTRISLV